MQRADLKVEGREAGNRSLARRLRREGRVPGVVYGASKENEALSFEEKEIRKITKNNWSANYILTLDSEDSKLKGKQVVIHAIERDPVTWRLVHVDLYEIAFDKPLTVAVPIEYTGTAKGVKLDGGILNVVRRQVRVRALPDNLPEKIEYDISELAVGENVHVSDLEVSDKVTVLDSDSFTLVSVAAPGEEEPEPTAAAATAEGEGEAGAEAAPAGEASKEGEGGAS